jgi:Domain of unknown function (DUF4407)
MEKVASFFTKVANWLLGDHGSTLPPVGSTFLKAIAIALAIYAVSPAIWTVLRKTPELVDKFVKLFTELIEQLLEALRTIISEKIPVLARFIATPSSYSRIVLWCAATDHEALAIAASNGSGINRRLLTPYHAQFILGLVVLLLAAWSGLGLSFAVYMSLRGRVDSSENASLTQSLSRSLESVRELGVYEITAVVISGVFFALMIMAVDRTIVSTVRKHGLKGEWARTASIWVLRIVVSLVLASWIAETYSVFLNRHLIEKHLRNELDAKIQALEVRRNEVEKEKDDFVSRNLPVCQLIKTQISKIPDRLERESLKCPKRHETGGECKGVEYKGIKAEEQELQNRLAKECDAKNLSIPKHLSDPGTRFEQDISAARIERNSLTYDISQGSDALQAVGRERFLKRHPPPEEPNWYDSLVTWLTFSPHKTFLVLLVVDLLPLIVKMLIRTSYFSVLEKAEELRELHMNSMPKLSHPAQNRRKIGWNPLFTERDDNGPERRSALP